MWKNIKVFLIGFISAVVSILLFIITGRKSNSTKSLKRDIDKNNNDIRQGLDRSEKLVKEARRANTGLGNINRSAIDGAETTERIVSEIIRNAKRTDN